MDTLDPLKTFVEATFYAVGIFAAALSAWNYRRNSRRERTRWLFELYQRFYEQSTLKTIWRRIDEEGTAFLGSGEDSDLRAAFDELLNFFEFIALLHRRKELRKQEITDLFSYPLAKLGTDGRTRAYLRQYDYEHLAALLEGLGYAG